MSDRVYRKGKYIQDLFIVSEDGRLFYLTEEEWKKREVPFEGAHDEVKQAVDVGTVLATLPEEEGSSKTSPMVKEDGSLMFYDRNGKESRDQIPGACFLLNISALKIPKGEG